MARLSPRAILAIGWLGLLIYAHPGYLSRDAIDQLVQARVGPLTDAHPPLMTVLWKVIDFVIPGPFGMLVLQTACFVVGAYLILGRVLPPRRAAAFAVAILWFPPVAATLAVIWPASLACALLALGTGLVLTGSRIAGLAILALAATLHASGFAMTFPIVTLLFAIRAGWQRYALAIAAWLVTTAFALALATLIANDAAPAVAPAESVYVWFTDVRELSVSAGLIEHGAVPSGIQAVAHSVMTWLGSTWLFEPYLYGALAAILIPLCLRDRVALVVLASGLACFVVREDPHFRAACWLTAAVLLAAVLRFAARAPARPST